MTKRPDAGVLLLIDGNSILHRAYHAFPKTLTTSKGELTNAVYGFTRILLAVLKKFHPEYVAVSFDTAAPTFRHQEFAPYKEHRPKMDEELASQLDRVHEVVDALGIPVFEVGGYEADDVIGSLAEQAAAEKGLKGEGQALKAPGLGSKFPPEPSPKSLALGNSGPEESAALETIIVTDDQDLLQLVNDSTKVYMARKGELWDREKVCEAYGFGPEKIDDYKALRGDPSDNIPGVRGIGPKTARDLLLRFDSLEGVYENLNKVELRVQSLLAESAEMAALSKKLATIVTDVPIELELGKCRTREFDRAAVEELLSELEFNSLLKMLPGDGWGDESSDGGQMSLL